jgi:RNA polymerase sigma factor (sigma-70 family)
VQKDMDKLPSDNALLTAIGDGDPMALRLLMDRYDRLVRFTVYRGSRQRCHRDPLWLDSVASEVWTDLYKVSRSGPPEVSNMASYLIQISRRRCIDALRRRGEAALAAASPDRAEQMEPFSPQEDTADSLAAVEELEFLRACMEQLDEEGQRLCTEIAAITAGHWRDAAGRLGMPESTLRSRWARVLVALRRCLQKKQQSPRA